MPYEPITNFRDSNNVDLGKKLVTKDYLLSVYGSLLDTLAPGLTFTPELWTWGRNAYGQLGINTTVDKSTPVTTFAGGANWKQVSGGYAHVAAIKNDGTLWTWGVGSNGELGTNNIVSRSTPVTTFAGGTNWRQVSCGRDYTAAIKTDGTLWIWGTANRLGTNDISGSKSTPVTTFSGGTNWKQVSCGALSTAAIKTDGTLWVWGLNTGGSEGGNLGINRSAGIVYTPVTTFAGGNNWKDVDVGNAHTAAVKTDGTLWIWGENIYAQLADNTSTTRSTPVTTFAGGTNWKQVSCGFYQTAAIKTDGTLWTWGVGSFGQLGNNTASGSRSTPVTTFAGGNNWKQVNCKAIYNAAAIKTDGTLWLWGLNSAGQLGINNTTQRNTPVTTFVGGNNWKKVHLGNRVVLAIKSIDYI